jgi:hypothetical protein
MLRIKQSEFMKKNNPMKNRDISRRSGLSRIGLKRPDLSLRNILRTGEKRPITSSETREKISKANKGNKRPDLTLYNLKYKKQQRLGTKQSILTKQKIRESHIKYIIETRGNISPNIGKHEKQYIDWIEQVIGYPIIRQYPCKGYFIDGYCKERNLAIEIDERPKIRPKDIERENIIKQELNCEFLRINDGK